VIGQVIWSLAARVGFIDDVRAVPLDPTPCATYCWPP
jgi:hypothetical protein